MILDNRFKHIDHWDFITPSEAVRHSGNELKAFIVNYFNKYHYQLKDQEDRNIENLLFSLVEVMTVNINDLEGVGDTFVYSDKPKTEVDKFFNKYLQLLEDYKIADKKFITQFSNWYTKEAYLLMISNMGAAKHENKKANYKWQSLPIPGEGHKEKIVPEINEISEVEIIDYLQEYSDKVIPALDLDKYPHSFILIKPVSLVDPLLKTRPIGNFFFHIGLKERLSEVQIVNFLNLFVLTWLKKYWDIVFEKLTVKGANTDDVFDNTFYEYGNMDKISTANNIFGSDSINSYITRFYKNDEQNNKAFQNQLKNKIFPEIVDALFHIKAKKQKSLTSFSSYIYSVSRESFKTAGYEAGNVRKFIITHLIIKTGLLVFDLHFRQILDIIRNGETDSYMAYQESLDTAQSNDLKIYLQRDRLIYLGSHNTNNRQRIKENLISSLAPVEVFTLINGKTNIARLLDIEDDEKRKNILNLALESIDSIHSSRLGSSYPNLLRTDL